MKKAGPPWKILRIVSKGDYNYAVVPSHPNAIKYGYVLEHRVVMENKIGRLLNENEIVHHLNENKKDNSPNNLELMTNQEHGRHHGANKFSTVVDLRCPWCTKIFTRCRNKTHLIAKRGNYTCCSRQCNGKLSRSRQLQNSPFDLKERIARNVIKVYKSMYHKSP